MDSDEERDWSIHDLDYAPGTFHLHPHHRRTSSASSVSPSRYRGRALSLDLPAGYGSSAHSETNRATSPAEFIPNRPRMWSSSSVPALASASSFPPVEKQPRIRKHSLRSMLSQRSAAHIPETEDDDDVDSGRRQNQQQQYRRTRSDHEVVTGPRARSRSKDGERSQLSDRDALRNREEGDEEESFYTGSLHLDEEEGRPAERDESFNIPDNPPIIIWGFQLPAWCSRGKRPGWDRVAVFIVARAPCFWCFGFKDQTDRAILQRLNIICAVMALGQVISSLWLVLTTFVRGPRIHASLEDGKGGEGSSGFELVTSFWNINGTIMILGFLSTLTFTLNVATIPMIRRVNLMGAVRYLWALLWVIPFEILCVIGLFDYFRVTSVWLKHWWRDDTVAPFRKSFCMPRDTYNKECAAPIVRNVTDWCLRTYNATNCASIREAAQSQAESFMLTYYYFNAGWGLLSLFLLLLTVNTLEQIISRPIVQKSRESNVPAWFSLPMLGCIAIGLLYTFSTSSVLSARSGNNTLAWIGPLYIATGGLFFLASILGAFIGSYSILSTRHKRYKLVAVMLFILVMVGILVSLIAIFSGSIAFSLSLVEIPITGKQRGDIACFIDRANTCSKCEDYWGPAKCPEWTNEDVTKILQTQAKAGAALSAIFLIYPISALRFGFNLRKYILLYQIEYV